MNRSRRGPRAQVEALIPAPVGVALIATGALAASAAAATITGTFGPDRIVGTRDADVIVVLGGDDVSGPGEIEGNVVRGGAGDDRIFTRDGELDIVSCGPGVDVARLDPADAVEGATAEAPAGDCERVTRAAPRRGEDAREERPGVP